MKFLYVLVSSSKDYYSEQAYISILTLKSHNVNCFVSLLLDYETSCYLHSNFMELISLCNEIKVVNLPDISKKEKSRLLKTSMRRYIKGDFLFIDCDTIICENLQEIEKNENDIACVLDTHVVLKEHTFYRNIIQNYKRCGFNEAITSPYHFNSGVIFCKDNQRTNKFFDDWNKLWEMGEKNGVIIDQPSFNQSNVLNKNIIHEISGEWNSQLIHGGVRFLDNAKILHYFSSINNKYGNPFLINNRKIFVEIRKTKKIPESVKSVFSKPKELIEKNSTLLGDEVPREVLYQAPVRELIYLYKKKHLVYSFFRLFFLLIEKLHK